MNGRCVLSVIDFVTPLSVSERASEWQVCVVCDRFCDAAQCERASE